MQKKILLIFTILYCMLLTACGQSTKTITLPDPDEIVEVEIALDESDVRIYTGIEFQETLSALQSAKSINKESTDDTPDVENAIKIDLFFRNGFSRCYVYEDNFLYYVEQPYEGIFQIDESAYQQVLELIH